MPPPTIEYADASRADQMLARLDELPAPGPPLQQIIASYLNGAPQPDALHEIFETEPLLAARFCHQARAVCPTRSGTEDAARAIVAALGPAMCLDALLFMAVVDHMMRCGGDLGRRFNLAAFWRHALGVACIARRLISTVRPDAAPAAFVAGVLHDAGKAAFAAVSPKSYDRVVRRTEAARANIAEVEHDLLGIDHATAGHHLLQRWRLPREVVESSWLHHHPSDLLPQGLADPGLVLTVQLADHLARGFRIGWSGNYDFSVNRAELLAALELSEDRVATVMGAAHGTDIHNEVERLTSLVGLEAWFEEHCASSAHEDWLSELEKRYAILLRSHATLTHSAAAVSAMGELAARASTGISVRESCAAAADAIRHGLGLNAVLVLASATNRHTFDLGLAAGDTSASERVLFAAPDQPAVDEQYAVEIALSGGWLQPTPPTCQALLLRYAQYFADGDVALLPLIQDGRWVAAALLAADASTLRRLRPQSSILETLSRTAAMVIASARAQTASSRSAEEQANLTRRWARNRDEALRARTLVGIAEMASGAAHELNTPLAVISGRAQYLLQSAEDADLRANLATISKQVSRCSRIVAELNEFASPEPPNPLPFDLGVFLTTMRDEWMAAGKLAAERFVIVLSDDLPHVFADPAQVRRALDEIVRNAVEASRSDRLILTIKTRPGAADDWIAISVTDNGCGMSPDVLERACDPFFSSRPAGRGRGLGLSRALRWVELNGGRLRIDSAVGEGTCVEITLPAHTD